MEYLYHIITFKTISEFCKIYNSNDNGLSSEYKEISLDPKCILIDNENEAIYALFDIFSHIFIKNNKSKIKPVIIICNNVHVYTINIYEKYFSNNYSRSNELSHGMSTAWPSGSVEFNLDEARRDTQSPSGDEHLSTRPKV